MSKFHTVVTLFVRSCKLFLRGAYECPKSKIIETLFSFRFVDGFAPILEKGSCNTRTMNNQFVTLMSVYLITISG